MIKLQSINLGGCCQLLILIRDPNVHPSIICLQVSFSNVEAGNTPWTGLRYITGHHSLSHSSLGNFESPFNVNACLWKETGVDGENLCRHRETTTHRKVFNQDFVWRPSHYEAFLGRFSHINRVAHIWMSHIIIPKIKLISLLCAAQTTAFDFQF